MKLGLGPKRRRATRVGSDAQLCTDLLPAPPVGVGDDIEQRVGQVAVTVEGIVPPTDGDVGEVPERR